MHLVKDELREVVVAKLIDQELRAWRSKLIMDMFEKEDAEAIYRIQLSQRYVEDLIIWLHHKKGLFIVKSAYKVAKEVMRGGNVVESLRGCVGKRIWTTLWAVIGDIQHLIRNLHWVSIECTRGGRNRVAHVLAQFARNIIDDMYWMEDLPPIAREAFYQDANFSD